MSNLTTVIADLQTAKASIAGKAPSLPGLDAARQAISHITFQGPTAAAPGLTTSLLAPDSDVPRPPAASGGDSSTPDGSALLAVAPPLPAAGPPGPVGPPGDPGPVGPPGPGIDPARYLALEAAVADLQGTLLDHAFLGV